MSKFGSGDAGFREGQTSIPEALPSPDRFPRYEIRADDVKPQPREHPVRCVNCLTATWNPTAVCDNCEAGT